MKNKKIKLIFALLPSLGLFSCGEDISKKEYKLDIYDYFEQVVEMPKKEYYKANEVVEITLKKHDDARCGGIVNNEIDLELFGSNELGNIYTFTMPSKDSILKVTYDGYFYDACEIGEHQFDDGRKASEYSNMLVYTCQVCGYQTNDYKEVTNSYKFDIVLEKNDIYDTSYSYVEGDDFELEYGYRYSLKIYFSLADFKENINEQIFIDTSSNLIVDFSHCSTYSKYAHYYLYVKDTGESYINITCPKGTYKFNLNTNEFDLESSGYKTPTTIEEALEYKEFRYGDNKRDYYRVYKGYDKRKPTIFFIYSGGLWNGSPKGCAAIGKFFYKYGFTVVIPSYELAPEHKYPVQMENIFSAFKHYVENNKPNRIVVMGYSSGADLAANLVYNEDMKEKFNIELKPEVRYLGGKNEKEVELCKILYQK